MLCGSAVKLLYCTASVTKLLNSPTLFGNTVSLLLGTHSVIKFFKLDNSGNFINWLFCTRNEAT